MRRAIVTGTATVSGVVLLLGLKPHSTTPLAAKGANNKFTITQPEWPAPSRARRVHRARRAKRRPSRPRRRAFRPLDIFGRPPHAAKTVTGDAAETRYGPVQLSVTFNGKKITQIQVLEYPTETGRDQEINNFAIPQLNQQAMTAQSANIDGVSGATYTSEGYQQSLQSAIDKAGA